MTDEDYMKIAIKEAQKCIAKEDVPVGAVIVKNGQILAKAYNQRELKKLTTAHAEIIAINKANKKLNCNRLDGAVIYITKEPCLMCMGAILSARINKIIFGAYDPRFGTKDLATNNNFNHKCEIIGGVCESDCKALLTNFFKILRKRNASSRETKHKN
ncbi:MAG: nucleoside deaminase [Christensenellales bacterium]